MAFVRPFSKLNLPYRNSNLMKPEKLRLSEDSAEDYVKGEKNKRNFFSALIKEILFLSLAKMRLNKARKEKKSK